MAYEFTAASSQYLSTQNTSIVYPFTISAFVYPKATGNFFAGLFQNGGLNNRDRAFIRNSGTKLIAQAVNEGSVAATSTTSNDFTRESWNHIAGTFSLNSRIAYLNGIGATPNTTSVSIQTPLIVLVNDQRYSNQGNLFDLFGDANYAEVGIWSAALTAAEIASLADGMTCDKVRPQNLVFYAPLVRDLIDQKGGLTITNNNGATVANHPRIYP
jgi:hypothetical protein